MFSQSEALYHWATKAFLRYSWPELATYTLLQEAFCQQVQWRTERTQDVSVFRSTQPSDVIYPAWWPQNWWQESLAAVAEHHVRHNADQSGKKRMPLLAPHPPLSVHSLRPLFKLISVDLKNANAATHNQCILLQLNVSGYRRFYASYVYVNFPNNDRYQQNYHCHHSRQHSAHAPPPLFSSP
ncbi:unnamed protein product [Dibothriocephalus latus]|uniref:Uncharacterized protein n=1 Tax=Dibothriocephalus latus TaxID=60516 RepID=A0A3P7NYN9_DIBLA|nr:unnamed protein product [Dibothriocephalus latus]